MERFSDYVQASLNDDRLKVAVEKVDCNGKINFEEILINIDKQSTNR